MKALSLAFLLGISACSHTIAPPAKRNTVDHVVLVWLKHPERDEDRQALLAASQTLRTIPGLIMLDSGTALPSSRPVVDDSFDVGFVMRFESPEALQNYESHPTHVSARKTLQALSRRIQIYDITR